MVCIDYRMRAKRRNSLPSTTNILKSQYTPIAFSSLLGVYDETQDGI